MHLPVAFRRIVALDVDLADAFAERVVDQVDAALPAVALHRARRAASSNRKSNCASSNALGRNWRVVADEVEGR